jgi:arylformamidase
MFKRQKIFDISIPLHENTITYPGNPAISIVSHQGKTSLHSEITIGSHTGTHVDVPKHVFKDGAGVGSISLEKLVGPCRVLDMRHCSKAIQRFDLESCNIKKGERILVKTKNSERGFGHFYNDYVYLEGDAAEFLADAGIFLFGIDYLSVKQCGSGDNRPHTVLLKKNIVIFEGLDLSAIEPGAYMFIGLPLLFPLLDGAPARVILLATNTISGLKTASLY